MEYNTENISCNFCGSNKQSEFDEIESWKIVRCNICGFLFTNPRPVLKDLKNFYSEEYYKDERHCLKYYNNDGSLASNETQIDAGIIQIENHVSKRGKLLEIGAARGDLLVQLYKRGWEVYGIELSESAVKIAKEKNSIDLFCGTFNEYNPSYNFDVICMYQTLEHLPNPKEVLQKCFNKLNPGGILIISVPNVKSFDLKINFERKRLSYDLPRHLNHFSHNFLANQLKNMGFKILEKDLYYPNFILSIVKILTSKKQLVSEKEITNDYEKKGYPELFKDNTTFKGKVLKHISSVFPGWKMTIVAKKPETSI